MRERNLQLDLLRCAAIMGVLVTHTILFRYPRWWWDRFLVGGGWTGVDLFFVLSGFLISGLLFSEFQKRERINFARFAIRRALKLYPTLYVLVFGITLWRLIHSRFHSIGSIIKPALHDIFFVQSYFPGTYGHFWSLSVEEHFYILLPLTLYFMLRRRRRGDSDPFRKLPLIFLLVAVFSLAVRIVHAVFVQPYNENTHLFPTHLRLDSLLFGVLLSYWSLFHREKFGAFINRVRPFLFPMSLLLIIPAFIGESNFIRYTVGLSLLYLGYGCLMIGLLQVPLTTKGSPGWLLRPISYIGQHSYPIYVFHVAIMEQISKRNLLHGAGGMILYFACTVAFGILFSKVIEFPVLHLRDRIFPPEVVAEVPAGVPRSESAANTRLVASGRG
jgi:peptidoglycan/LPS O-acetylase OafA/YrhL